MTVKVVAFSIFKLVTLCLAKEKRMNAVVRGAQKCNPLSAKPCVVCFVSRPLEHISFII